MKIFSAAQIKECDQQTIEEQNISSLDLMERAARKTTEWIMEQMPKDALFVALCGTGNNGGDGLAVARMLHQSGYGVKVFLLQLSDRLSDDCLANFQRLQKVNPSLINVVPPGTFITDIGAHIIIIDAIFGTGLNRPPEGWTAKFIENINHLPNKKIAIDIPSGLYADNVPSENSTILKADYTLSFQFYKRSFLHAEGRNYTGKIDVLDIGLNEHFIQSTHSIYKTIDREIIQHIYQPRKDFTHKGTYGTALLVGGSYGMMGAITLSAKAALRAGAGKVIALIPETGYTIFQTALPEAMCTTTPLSTAWRGAGGEVIGIGPGLGTAEKTKQAFVQFIDNAKQPLVLDADALNIIAGKKELLHKLPPNSILTPHPKEFERLFGETADSMQRLENARTQAMQYKIIIVLKDHHTAVITPDGACWYNTTGNAGMATAGAGDVLTGMITGLLAQQYEPHEAALLGVYLHGLAGDSAAKKYSKEAMIASDIIECIGEGFKELKIF